MLTVGVCVACAIGAGRCAGAAPVEKRAGAASETVSLATNSCPGNPQSLFPQSVSAGGSAEIVLFFYLVEDFLQEQLLTTDLVQCSEYRPSVLLKW